MPCPYFLVGVFDFKKIFFEVNINDTAVLILNWKSPEETVRCVQSLIESPSSPKLTVILENGSNDNSVKIITEFLSSISQSDQLIDLSELAANAISLYESNNAKIIFAVFAENAGFAGGMNRAIEIANKFSVGSFFLLNNDAEIDGPSIEKIERISRQNNDALVGPMIYDFYKRNLSVFAGSSWPYNLFGLGSKKSHQCKGNFESDYLEGSALFLPKKFVDKKNQKDGYIFDERFFLYCEDVDLCLSAKSMGFPCLIASDLGAYHKVSISSGGMGSLTAYYYITRNRILLAKKWLPRYGQVFFNLYYLASRLVLGIKRFARPKQWKINRVVFNAILDGLRGKWGSLDKKNFSDSIFN